MDMPDDTPTKPGKKHQLQENQQNSDEDDFSSFQSNHKHEDQSQKSVDENGFRNCNTHKEKQMAFPEVPPNLGKLYQIYIHNVNRKKQLKKSIDELIQKQLKALRVAYDKQTFSIEQFIDLDEESKQYAISKQNYEKRKQELQKLARQYKQFKIAHVQSMMMSNQVIKSTMNSYVSKYKRIIHTYIHEDTITVLCEQKFKNKKMTRNRNRNEKKGTKKMLEGEDQSHLEKGVRSRNASQTSQDEQEGNTHQKFMFRYFTFYKNENGVYFQPLQHSIELPIERELIGFVVDPYTKDYIVYEKLDLYTMFNSSKQLKIKSMVHYDRPIIFCEVMKNLLYVGTDDGIIWVYDLKQDPNKITLIKFALCSYYGNQGPVTHFSLTNNPDIILFVKEEVYLCQMNLSTYSSYLLSQLPEKVQLIDSKMLMTKNMCYVNYYAAGPTHGKAILQQNQKLNNTRKNKQILKIHTYKNEEYLIYNEGHGVLSISQFL